MSISKRVLRVSMFVCFSAISLISNSAAQQTPAIQGDFVGELGPLHLNLHIIRAADGTLSVTLDSLDQGAKGISCTDFRVEGQTLSFSVPDVGGSWKGSIEDNGAKLSGTWTQGSPAPLTFTRDTFVPASKPSLVDGFWLGTLRAPNVSLRIQIIVKSDQAGREFCTLDSLDQGAFNLPCANVIHSGNDFSFDVPVVGGHWSGRLSPDGKFMDGTWTQGAPIPLRFERQAAFQAPPEPKPQTFEPAIAPVRPADMEAVL